MTPEESILTSFAKQNETVSLSAFLRVVAPRDSLYLKFHYSLMRKVYKLEFETISLITTHFLDVFCVYMKCRLMNFFSLLRLSCYRGLFQLQCLWGKPHFPSLTLSTWNVYTENYLRHENKLMNFHSGKRSQVTSTHTFKKWIITNTLEIFLYSCLVYTFKGKHLPDSSHYRLVFPEFWASRKYNHVLLKFWFLLPSFLFLWLIHVATYSLVPIAKHTRVYLLVSLLIGIVVFIFGEYYYLTDVNSYSP